MNRKCAAARLYVEAFAADATLAARVGKDDARFSHRTSAARAAALADCGQDEDAAVLSAAWRKKWRSQAREWLLADLAAWDKALDPLDQNPDAARADVRRELTQWRTDPELAGLREPAELEKLPLRSGSTASRFGTRWTPCSPAVGPKESRSDDDRVTGHGGCRVAFG